MLDAQGRIDQPQPVVHIDKKVAVIGVFADQHERALLRIAPRDHPEDRLGPVEQRYRLGTVMHPVRTPPRPAINHRRKHGTHPGCAC